MNRAPVVRDVVLVGGGHSHALLVRRWAMQPLPGVRLTLVSDGVLTPYSGMLPGLIAGHYSVDEVHIDLMRLCQLADVRFINARMTSLDPVAQSISIVGRPDLQYDCLSLDTGSTPDLSVAGAREHSTPVKPVHTFHARWLAIRDRVSRSTQYEPLELGVVGSGAGGFEVTMAIHHALRDAKARVHWFLRGDQPLSGRPPSVGRRALTVAKQAGVVVHTGFDVARVDAGPCLHAADGREVVLDDLLWCTGAVGPDWVRASGLLSDVRGFVLTDANLRSVSHPSVFATGDIGTQRDTPSPKAGVYAVRQAPVLFDNLRRTMLGQTLRAYRPQSDFLSLMATGPQHAIASRGPFVLAGKAIWRWKDRIDRTFMNRIHDVPAMGLNPTAAILPNALRDLSDGDTVDTVSGQRCRGCGAKVASDVLEQSLARHASAQKQADVIVGVAEAGDVSVFDPGESLVVQSVDQISALVDDPWLFSRIAVRHAVADVLTAGVKPHSAQLTLTLPPASKMVQQRELDLILQSLVTCLNEEGINLLGGHTAEGPELHIGLTINSLADRRVWGDDGVGQPLLLCEGDRLVLTRALGTGMLFAGAMRGMAAGEDIAAALDLMQSSQSQAATLLHTHGARIMTDVTGFGFAGHLERLLATSKLRARIQLSALPWLEGAYSLAESGVQSSLYPANAAALKRMDLPESLSNAYRRLLCDPQTAGGFLAVIPADSCADTVTALKLISPQASVIGTLEGARAGEGHVLE